MSSPVRNLVVTGIPRSGTTLTAALLDSLPDAVCFNEPQWQARMLDLSNPRNITAENFAVWLVGDYVLLRRKLIAGEQVIDRRGSEGVAVTDYYLRDPENQTVHNTYEMRYIRREGLPKHFLLAVKHNGLYTGALREILDTRFFKVIALMRHPHEVILSWRTLGIPPSRGQLPGAACFWKEMKEVTESEEIGLLEKQVRIYEMVCQRYWELRDRITILKYEDLIADPNLLCRTLELPPTLSASGVERRARQHDPEEYAKVGECIRKHANFIRKFYPDI